ncbi:MAG: Ig-like domain repeat protein [Lachnospiraceae bacterium]|nr:Ig-like domain repeat protein [Lachnospiraceae bacterium]
MRSTFTKITALILSAALMFSANDVISFAKGGQNLRDAVVVEKNDEGNQSGSVTGRPIEEPATADMSDEGTGAGESAGSSDIGSSEEDTTVLGTTEPDMSEPDTTQESTTEPDTSEPDTTQESTTEPDTSEPDTTEEATSDPEDPDEVGSAKIANIKLVETDDKNVILQKDSNGKYYTKRNRLTAELDIVNNTESQIILEVDGRAFEGYDGKSEKCEYPIELSVQREKKIDFELKIDGEVVATESVTIIYDATKPKIGVKHFAMDEKRELLIEHDDDERNLNRLYTNEEEIVVKFEATDNESEALKVQVMIDDKVVDSMEIEAGGKEYIYHLCDIKQNPVIKYTVTDKAGNFEVSDSYKVFYDKKEPEWVTEGNPEWVTEGKNIILNDNKTISVRAKDTDTGIKRVYIEGRETAFTNKGENDVYTYALNDDDIQLVKNSKKDIMNCVICVEDKAGNRIERAFDLFFDFTAPEIRIMVCQGDKEEELDNIGDETNKKYYTKSNCTLKIEVEDKKNSGYESGAKSFVVQNIIENESVEINCEQNDNKYNIPFRFEADQNVKETKKIYQVTVSDNRGNEDSCNVAIIYDIQEPQITVDALKESKGVRYYNSAQVPIKITEGNFESDGFELDIVDKDSNQKYRPEVDWGSEGERTNICTVTLADGGVYGLTAKCRDKLGNEAEFKIDKLVIDETKPQVEITYGPDEEKEKTHYNKPAKIEVTDKNFDDTCFWSITESGKEKKYKGINWEIGENTDTHFCTVNYEDEGVYEFEFICRDKAGNETASTSDQIVIDHTAPQITVSFDEKKPINGNVYKEARVATITIKEQNFDKKNIEIEWIDSNQTGTLPKLSNWEPNGTDYTATISFVDDGKYGFRIKCTDKAGNIGESQEIEEFIVDRKAPVIKFEYDFNQQSDTKYYTEAKNVKVTVEDDNFDEESGIQIITEAGTVEPKKSKVSQSGNVYTYTVSMEEDGKYLFKVSAKDKAGNETVQDCVNDITIDKTRPKIEVSFSGSGAKNGKYYNGARTATIKITEKNFKNEGVTFEPVGGTAPLPAINSWSNGGGDIHTAEVIFDKDGVYSFIIKCTDAAGNSEESPYESGEFVIDLTEPTVEIEYDKDSPVNGKYYNTSRTAKIIVTDENFDEKSAMKFDITSDSDKPKIGKWTKSKSDASGSSQYTCDVIFEIDGEYSFKFSCEDLAGNKSNVGNGGSFVIDTTKPEISVTYDNNNVKNGKYYNNSRTATITIKDKAFADNLVSVESLNPSGGNGLPSISGWTASGDTHTAKISFMEDGSYGFRVKCTDLADNAAKDYLGEVFIIDRSAPEIVFGGVRKNSANNGVAAPTLKCTDAYLDEAGTQIILTGTNHGQLAGIAQKSAIKDGIQLVYPDFEHTQDMDDFYTLTVKAVDLAGNETEDELNFSINRFGSTYRISADTQKLMSGYYIGKAPTITVTEINIDELEYGEVTISKDGQTVTLKQGSDYAVAKEGEEENWKSYTYSIKPGNFAKDGVYSVGFYSKDKASNTSDNRIKGKEIEFALDTTAPSIVADGIESGMTYNEKSREVTVDVKDNMFLTRLTVTDNDEMLVDMSEKELAENGGIVTFTLDEADGLRDVVITAMDKVNNVQKLEFLDVLITSKKEVITTIENEKAIADTGDNIVKPVAGAGIVLPSYDEDDSLLYMVIEVMSAAVLITAVVTFYRKKRKIRK